MAQPGTTPSSSTTRIIPLDNKDQFKPLQAIRCRTFFVLPKAFLDEDLLRQSLDTLIRHHIPILGARLHTNSTTKLLEYHLPEPFPPSYTLFDWPPTTCHGNTLQEAGILPPSTPADDAPSFGPLSVMELEAALAPPGWPEERADEKPDCPLLVVHISRYTNGSVLSLNIPHAVSDQLGCGSMIRAWLQVAAGREPTPFLTLNPGELDGDASIPERELRVKGRLRLYSKIEKAVCVLGLLPDMILHPEVHSKVLFLPVNVVERLRDRYNKSLREKGDNIVLTNGDVVAALLLKLAHIARKFPRMLTFSGTLNVRGHHPSLPADKPYLHNAINFSYYRHRLDRNTPVFDLAVQTRLAVLESLKPETISRNLRILHQMTARGDTILIMNCLDMIHAVTSWSAAWRDIDFGPVISAESVTSSDQNGDTDGKLPKEALPIIFGHAMQRKHPKRHNAQILCKANGGFWCDFTASRATIEIVQEFFRKDPFLESL